jgi:hypothetical protein
MNRQQRRQHRRDSLADLRRAGCTCTPEMTPAPGIDTPTGPTGPGYHVHHEDGCPFGALFAEANRAGRVPIVLVQGSQWGCVR